MAKNKSMRRHTQGDTKPKDIVVPVMGPTGAGKSTFINCLLGENRMRVGHQLSSCTSELQVGYIDLSTPGFQGCRLVIVDTPGFDDTYEGDAVILRRIAEWLEKSYRQNMVLGGVLYLHDISNDRFSGTARRNLEMFQHLCGDAALSKVVLGTTKWKRTPVDIGVSHEKELKEVHWKPLINKGSTVRRFVDDRQSAMSFVEGILQNLKRRETMDTFLQIQEEIAVDHKIIPETKAGKELRYTLQEVLEMQKQMVNLEASIAEGGDEDAQRKLEETQKKMETLVTQIKDLKIPFKRRVRSLFGFS